MKAIKIHKETEEQIKERKLAIEDVILNVKVNLKGLNNEKLKSIYTKEVKKILIEAEEIKNNQRNTLYIR